MPIPVILWVITTALTTALAVTFAEEIKEWAKNTTRAILNAIDRAIFTIGEAVASLVYNGRQYIKEVKVWLFNEETEQYEIQTKTQVVPADKVPDEVKRKIQKQREVEGKREIKISEIQ